jgi:hypothetical protein
MTIQQSRKKRSFGGKDYSGKNELPLPHMNKILPYLIVLISILSFFDCKKDNVKYDNPYGLPNATQTGAGIFAWRLNGENMIAKNGVYSQGGKYSYDSTILGASFGNSYYLVFGIHVLGHAKLNSAYAINDKNNLRFYYSSDSTCFGISSKTIEVDTAFGSVTFTRLDSVNKIISGTFSFKVPIPNCDTLNFTDGRFDMHY